MRAIEDEFVCGIAEGSCGDRSPADRRAEAAVAAIVNAKEIHIAANVEPELIGGVRIETPGKLLDATIKRKLLGAPPG